MQIKKLFVVIILSSFINCAVMGPPPNFIRTYDEAATWQIIELRNTLNKDSIWAILTDVISGKFDLEVLDKDSGYIRTSWKYTYIVRSQVVDRYRTRVVLKITDINWKMLRIKSEANWLSKGGWEQGYDTLMLEDTVNDLKNRIGR